MNKRRETLMLCQTFDPDKHHDINGWFVSEKLDGFRAFWDGGITRGLPCEEVPWANVDKHDRYQNRILASGLWSRYYQPIQAPIWFLDQLPNWPLDGELWCGRRRFQETMSICKKLEPIDSEWEKIQYCVFDIPTLYQFVKPGIINLPNFRKEITQDMWEWVKSRFKETNNGGLRPNVFRFGEVVDYFVTQFPQLSNVEPIVQWYNTFGIEGIEGNLNLVDVLGGEGIVIRNPYSYWIPERSGLMLKMKKSQDAEATVVGYVGGKKTDRGSKLLGLMGALIVECSINEKIIRFELSGFTDEERIMTFLDGRSCIDLVVKLEGQILPSNLITNPEFPIGSKITFKYNGLSDNGIPRHARYWRKST